MTNLNIKGNNIKSIILNPSLFKKKMQALPKNQIFLRVIT